MSIETEARHAPSGVDGMPPVVLGIVLFICSEAVFFSALFAGWFTARSRSPQWPPSGIHVNPTLGAIAAGLLILSSITVSLARNLIRRGDVPGMQSLMWAAVIVALVAVAGQGLDLSGLSFGVHTNGFGTIYWMTSIIDSAHIFGAAIFGLIVIGRARAGGIQRSNHDLLTAAVIFWHFVVGLSIFTFLVLEVVA
ncbi:MAG TPA: cytochrome c oxidase subunit 3 [Nocardioidaceae bacterium]|nr:cytochrome c oxidase subunit 3 [Nocardioidaceae bacterium]